MVLPLSKRVRPAGRPANHKLASARATATVPDRDCQCPAVPLAVSDRRLRSLLSLCHSAAAGRGSGLTPCDADSLSAADSLRLPPRAEDSSDLRKGSGSGLPATAVAAT